MLLVLFSVGLRVLEVGASLLTGFSLLAIAIHEIWGSNGWRPEQRRRKR